MVDENLVHVAGRAVPTRCNGLGSKGRSGMSTKSRINSQLWLVLVILGIDSAAMAQQERYACGVDDPIIAQSDPGKAPTTTQRVLSEYHASERARTMERPRRPVSASRQEEPSADRVLRSSAAAIRQKLRSEQTRLPDARRNTAISSRETLQAPEVLAESVRDERHWSLLPKFKSLDQLFSRSHKSDSDDAIIQQASHTEPVEREARTAGRSTQLSRHMTPEELADYVKQRRTKPWWRLR